MVVQNHRKANDHAYQPEAKGTLLLWSDSMNYDLNLACNKMPGMKTRAHTGHESCRIEFATACPSTAARLQVRAPNTLT